MFDHNVLVLDERGPGVLIAGGSMVTSISNYIHRSKDPGALERQVRRWTRSMNHARSDFADATPPAGQPKLGEFLRPKATMPQPLLPPSSTTATSAVPSAVPTAMPTAVPSAVLSDKTAAPKGITAHPRLAKFLRPLQPQPRRPPTESSAEDSLIRQTEERLSQKEAAKSAPRGSLKRATVAAALANVTMHDRVREAAAEARAAHDSSTATSSSEFEPSLAHKSRLRVKPSGRRVPGKQQLSEALKAHAEAKGSRSHGSQGRSQAPKESRLAEQTKKVKASAVVEARKVVRHAKDESAKPQAVTEQAAKDQVANGRTVTGQGPKPQAAIVEGGNKSDPTAGLVADLVAAKNEATKQQEANEDEPEEQPEEPAQVRPFEVHLNSGQPNSATSNIELEPLEWRLNSVWTQSNPQHICPFPTAGGGL